MAFPRIHTGTRFNDTRASDWNELFRAVQRLQGDMDRLRPVLASIGSRGFPAVRVNAAVIAQPEEGKPIKVRVVVAKNKPPQEGEYSFSGPAFNVWPDVGVRALDFDAMVWLEAEPTIDTPIVTVRSFEDYWVAELPQASERLVVLRGFADDDPGSRFAVVQEVRPEVVDGTWTGRYVTFGDVAQVNVWPNMVAGDFAPFVWSAVSLDDRTTLLPLAQYHGVWYLKQRAKRAVAVRVGPIKQLDCALAGGTTP